MHPYLTRLGVPKNVQLFLEPYYTCDGSGNLVFTYGYEFEHFGWAWHRVPAAMYPWTAGNAFAHQLVVATSAMECVAFLTFNAHRFPDLNLQLLALGLFPDLSRLVEFIRGRKVALVFGRDALGRLLDIKVAAAIRDYQVQLTYAGEDQFTINGYAFTETTLSLNAFEKASGFRAGIRTYKAKGFTTFLDQLKS